MDHRYSNKIT